MISAGLLCYSYGLLTVLCRQLSSLFWLNSAVIVPSRVIGLRAPIILLHEFLIFCSCCTIRTGVADSYMGSDS